MGVHDVRAQLVDQGADLSQHTRIAVAVELVDPAQHRRLRRMRLDVIDVAMRQRDDRYAILVIARRGRRAQVGDIDSMPGNGLSARQCCDHHLRTADRMRSKGGCHVQDGQGHHAALLPVPVSPRMPIMVSAALAQVIAFARAAPLTDSSRRRSASVAIRSNAAVQAA